MEGWSCIVQAMEATLGLFSREAGLQVRTDSKNRNLKNICEGSMGLKIRLDWYDKRTELGEGKEYSRDMGDDMSAITALGLGSEPRIYDGGFDVLEEWIPLLQPLFNHSIAPEQFDYQISFRYRTAW